MKKSSGKHQKFLPVSNYDLMKGQILIPGRHACLCEATKHELINNCIHCGRIVCAQEGSGPCFTCGELVCTPKEQEIIIRKSKAGCKLYNKLMNQDADKDRIDKSVDIDSGLQNALAHRDKLLEFDRTVERRAKVIDDENDYFQVDSKWLSAKERKILNEKKEEVDNLLLNRQKQKLTFDFAGRKIIEETPEIKVDVEELLKSDTSIFECKDASSLNIALNLHPVYEEQNSPKNSYTYSDISDDKHHHIRIQDKELQEMSDEGMCLSLHQPHASLLAAGIKKHEGRIWYTSYRGRLWIHSAGKTPTQREITEIENLYRSIVGNCAFPESYPTGCLLGCVDLVDCLPQEEYKIQFPYGEIASPYVLICEDAQQLTIKFPMTGKHKIFKLDANIHQAAKKTLRKLL
ncbi:hypothetical protein X975_12951, partial [Stegodyphus mimosarum]